MAVDLGSKDGGEAAALIVVHGVGNQERGATMGALLRTLGLVSPRGAGTQLVAGREVLARSGSAGIAPQGFDPDRNDAYCPHALLEWGDDAPGPKPCYEFYWADESRVGDSVWNRARSYWQLLVGLPRLGLYALDPPRGEARGPLDRIAQGAYTIAWGALVLRFLVALVMVGLQFGGVAGWTRLYGLLARADLLRTGADLLLLPVLLVWLLGSRRPGRASRAAAFHTALIALAAATVLTDLITMSLRLPLQDLSIRAIVSLVLEGDPADALGLGIEDGSRLDPPALLYVLNSLSGLTSILGYVVILAWGAWAGLGRLVRALRGGGVPSRRLAWPSGWWSAIAVVVLLIHPLAFQAGWRVVTGDRPGDWALVSPQEDQEDRAQVVEAQVFRAYSGFVVLVVLPFATASFLLLTSSSVRSSLGPGLELALDVLNYLPPRRRIDAHGVSRFLLGGRRAASRPPLDAILQARLRALIELAARRHGGPVQVVAHSLGSIVAVSALDDWEGPGGEGAAPIVDLTTMGSPLMMLAARLPNEFGAGRADGGRRAMPAVSRWRNFYYYQDAIGRSLDPEAAPKGPPPEFLPDLPLGDGTHTDYFADPRFARAFAGSAGG
ncbi:alpha/beta hydrolase [Paludisphaera soli]|uniref:alpha/beta hydrolase n=1 Tax=Paludisphaera soli TaxID=2712865 RepID=UPI0013ED3786|nr:alpha/beta hydrolase [Paludisphaera soli]